MSWLPKKRVLVPFDFSDASLEAVETGLQLVGSPSDMDVVYVIPTPHPAEPGVLWGNEAERIVRARTALVERLKEKKIGEVVTHVRSGNPGHEIVELAEEVGSELIVMPSHGRHGMSRVLVGSVTERVLRFAPCPLLVLRRAE